jgi:superfamily II DNA or RNA helicase
MVDRSPDWVHNLSDSLLLRHFGAETLRRGKAYARQSRVGKVSGTNGLLTAQVRGSGHRTYFTSVAASTAGPPFIATCTCPMRSNCKHAAALLVHLGGAGKRRATPAWQQALTPLTNRALPGRGGTRLALQVNSSAAGFWLRPLKMGARDKWVKTGAKWDDLRYDYGRTFDPAQREALLGVMAARRDDMFSYGRSPEVLHLSDLRPQGWAALRQAGAVGIELVAGDDDNRNPLPPVELPTEPFVPIIAIEQSPGGIRVIPAVGQENWEFALAPHAFVGRPAHGVAFLHEDRLILGDLSRPLDEAEQQLFVNSATIEVPEKDIGLFTTGYLPALRQKLKVRPRPGVELPESLPPTAVCRVEFADRRAGVDWAYRYRIGEHTHELPAVPGLDDRPIRDPAAEADLAASVPAGPWLITGPGGAPELHPVTLIGKGLIDFVTDVLPALTDRDDVEVELSEQAPQFREADEAPAVTLRISEPETGDWFDLGVEVTVDGERVPFAQLFTALSQDEDHLLLDSGTWFSLDSPELDQLRAVIEEARGIVDHDGDTFRLRPEHAGLWEELVSLGVVAEQSAAWQESVGALLDPDRLPDTAAPTGLQAQLRPYQLTGLRWLSFLWRTRLGGILADEMGLGKTLQALALAQSAYESGELGVPLLVVAPTSVLSVWAAEAAKFTPELRVVVITETEKRRGVPLAEAVTGAHLVLTSYTLLRLEAEDYQALDWSGVLLDEAQFVKNHASKAYQAVRRLRARTKVALTGTPLENNLMDLWSLLSISAPGLFPDPKKFTDVYRKPIEGGDTDALTRLHRRIRPLILRRTKDTVAKELPEKQEQVVPVELSLGHRRIYDKHLARERQRVLGLVGDLQRNRIAIFRSLTVLRQLSLSPALIEGEHLTHSAKIDTLVEMLGEVIAEGHRALVFSQFTGFLGMVKQRLTDEQIAFEYLDGRTRNRAARIEAFRSGSVPVFLISLKAGGFGLTLTEADYVFILDPWWNPAAEAQAVDRTHRIGQDKPVNVYRLVAADTIEEKVVALQERKRHLFAQVIGSGSDMAAPMSAEDIRGLLEP